MIPQKNLTEDRSNLINEAAKNGLLFGVFWVLKYLCVLGVFSLPFLGLIYLGLTVYVPFMAYSLTKKYRDSLPTEKFSFSHGWLYGVFLYIFASIIVTIPHFIFYNFVLPDKMPEILAQMQAIGIDSNTLDLIKEASYGISPIKRSIGDISTNTIWGIIFSIPVAIFLKRDAGPFTSNKSE